MSISRSTNGPLGLVSLSTGSHAVARSASCTWDTPRPWQCGRGNLTLVREAIHGFDAAIFDLDGVLTDTARVHAAAWKTVFDQFLQAWAQQHGLPFRPFDIEAEYLNYVDGRPRDDGIRHFLTSRGISLPQGSGHDPEDADSVHSLGERKTRLFRQTLQKGIVPAVGAEALLNELRRAGIRTAARMLWPGSKSANEAALDA